MKRNKTELANMEPGILNYTLKDSIGPIGRYFYQDFETERDLTDMEAVARPFILALLTTPGVNFVYFAGNFLTIYYSNLFDRNEINKEVRSILRGYGYGELSYTGSLQPRVGVSYGINEIIFDVREILVPKNSELFIQSRVIYKDTLSCRIANRILDETNADLVIVRTRQIVIRHKDHMDEIEKEIRQILKEELGWE